jgi:hypothetical protein
MALLVGSVYLVGCIGRSAEWLWTGRADDSGGDASRDDERDCAICSTDSYFCSYTPANSYRSAGVDR